MTFFKPTINVLLLAIVFLTACTNNNAQEDTQTNNAIEQHANTNEQQQIIAQDINVAAFANKINSLENVQILDVRTPQEWGEGTIKNAIKMNFYDADFDQQIEQLDKSKPVLVYCKSGGRSAQTMSKLKNIGFKETYNLLGGITAWKSANQPTVK